MHAFHNIGPVLKYIHANGAKATIPSKRNAKIQRSCDWWLYKDATPYKAFELIPDFEMYLLEYNRKRDEENA